MADHGYYEKRPRPESRKKLIEYLGTNPVVSGIEELDYQVLRIARDGKSALTVFLTNNYIVSQADVLEMIAAQPDINAIITMSAWNQYTGDAKDECKRRKMGLFTFKEFLGAVYYEGQKFVEYVPPDPNKPRARSGIA
ncbi:MAG TPA: hypothetical protein VMU87_04520 [Stellaceae bacterium]|nr:hypothetical protein [Stellaceae bacterium]